jgi:hypothetical protein
MRDKFLVFLLLSSDLIHMDLVLPILDTGTLTTGVYTAQSHHQVMADSTQYMAMAGMVMEVMAMAVMAMAVMAMAVMAMAVMAMAVMAMAVMAILHPATDLLLSNLVLVIKVALHEELVVKMSMVEAV